jgi:uncharacterized phage protein (TIGR02218 family)
MTYQAYEISVKTGEPVELYDFLSGSSHYRYTSGDANYTHGGNVYAAVPIRRSGFSQQQSDQKADLEVVVLRDHAVAALFSVFPPSGGVDLTVYRLHRADGNAITYWKGRIATVTWTASEAVLRCESLLSALGRVGRCQRWQQLCRFPLYSTLCGVVATDYDAAGVLTAVSGVTITAGAFGMEADGYWTGGFAVFGTQRRLIMAHAGDDLTLNAAFSGAIIGDTVTVYPGCDHTLTTCESKFSNDRYYGGYIAVPGVNPFSPVDSVWG